MRKKIPLFFAGEYVPDWCRIGRARGSGDYRRDGFNW
jgi:hypothetical protein